MHAAVRAGEREVRISSPERVIYEATDRTPAVTKLMVAEYFTSVEEGLMRALRDRPTALERWTSGVRPGMKLATELELVPTTLWVSGPGARERASRQEATDDEDGSAVPPWQQDCRGL